MNGLFETVLVEDGRVRLLERHLSRLARSGAAPAAVAEARALLAQLCLGGGPAVVARIDVGAGGVRAALRPPTPATPVRLLPVEGFDPADARRERKAADRSWAEQPEAMARSAGFDEPLLISRRSLVGETSRGNVFVVLVDGAVVTPPVAGILPGVTRSWVVEQCGALERPLVLAEAQGARAAFITTAGRGIVPVTAIGEAELADHPLIDRLASAWRAL